MSDDLRLRSPIGLEMRTGPAGLQELRGAHVDASRVLANHTVADDRVGEGREPVRAHAPRGIQVLGQAQAQRRRSGGAGNSGWQVLPAAWNSGLLGSRSPPGE